MELITLDVTNERDLRFTGELLAECATNPNQISGSFSGDIHRWTELSLYKTKAGKFVCYRVHRTQQTGEKDTSSVKVCDQASDIIEFFGFGDLAKDLYHEAGLVFVNDID